MVLPFFPQTFDTLVLSFTRSWVYILVSLCLILQKSPQRYHRPILLILFTLFLNKALKAIWQMPLAPHLGNHTWAFPSGHMQAAVTFWGYFSLLTSSRPLRFTLLLLTAVIGWGLVHAGFHSWIDIGGAVVFGVISIFILEKLFFFCPPRFFFLIPIILAFCASTVMLITPKMPSSYWYFIPLILTFSGLWFRRK
jgi:hypothetical protein